MSSAIRWTPAMLEQYQARIEARRAAPVAAPEKKRGRYGIEAVVSENGERFGSDKERDRWLQLKQLERAGLISDLKRQVSFELAPAVKLEGEKRKKPALRYFADASYIEAGQLVVEDTKGEITRKTKEYRIKKHLMATVHGIHIRET